MLGRVFLRHSSDKHPLSEERDPLQVEHSRSDIEQHPHFRDSLGPYLCAARGVLRTEQLPRCGG